MNIFVQLAILAGAVLALLAAIHSYGDSREQAAKDSMELEYTKKKEALDQREREHQAQMRVFALDLTKNYLKWQTSQDKLATGAQEAIREEMRRNPELRRMCLGVGGVQRFNSTSVSGPAGGSAAPGTVDGVVSRPEAAGTAGKPPGR